MQKRRNLLAFVLAFSEMSDVDVANLDREGANAMAVELSKLQEEIGAAIARLTQCRDQYSCQQKFQRH